MTNDNRPKNFGVKIASALAGITLAFTGLTAIATPAAAYEAPAPAYVQTEQFFLWGHATCYSRINRLTASRRGGAGLIVLTAPGVYYRNYGTLAFARRPFTGSTGNGSWYVGGNAATYGHHDCI